MKFDVIITFYDILKKPATEVHVLAVFEDFCYGMQISLAHESTGRTLFEKYFG
jgi:hypothetical protein